MLRFTNPTRNEMCDYREHCLRLPWSYPQIGATRGIPPAGFRQVEFQVDLGHGRDVYAAARQALQRWQMMPSSWVTVLDPNSVIRPGNVVSTWVRTPVVGVLGSCRIAYVVDRGAFSEPHAILSREPSDCRGQYGFAYGTLSDHVLQGEELFLVTWHHDHRVSYRIHSFARPASWWLSIASPFVRYWQRRFRYHSADAMRTAVQMAIDNRSAEGVRLGAQLLVG